MIEVAPSAESPGLTSAGLIESASTPLTKQRCVLWLLFLWTVLIACPIRYWPIDDSIDNTWVFAMNYAAAHGLAIGRDLIWTTGPIGYLAFPMDLGHNLKQALAFQCAVWVILIAIFLDLFFRARLPVRNLAYFSIFFSFSAPLYWFNFMGLENLLLAGVLILLVLARESGGRGRYVAALALTGVIPLIKLTGGMLAAGALFGFLADCALRNYKQGKSWPKEFTYQVALAIGIPLAAAAAGCWLFLPSLDAMIRYGKGSLEVVSGYSASMSVAGDPMEFAGVADVLIAIGAFLFVRNRSHRRTAWFLIALLAFPLLTSIKHGFVRQVTHVINFFGFAGLALALMALLLPLAGRRSIVAFLVLLNFAVLSLEYAFTKVGAGSALEEFAGVRGPRMALGALRLGHLQSVLEASTDYAPDARIEPQIRSIIGESSVASLSLVYSGSAVEGMNLQLYPVVQRYSAYTPYLDQLNADWIRSKGPRYLLFDGHTIDRRHPWAETPEMWLQIYRWYNTRLRGTRALLLERRSVPRFERLRSLGHSAMNPSVPFTVPALQSPVFWRVSCAYSPIGTVEKLFLRVPEVTMRFDGPAGDTPTFRSLPDVLNGPVPGNSPAGDLAGLATLLDPTPFKPLPLTVHFGGPGLSAYSSTCDLEYLTPGS